MTNSLDVLNRRPEQTEETANECEDNSIGIIQSQEQRGKLKIHEQSPIPLGHHQVYQHALNGSHRKT